MELDLDVFVPYIIYLLERRIIYRIYSANYFYKLYLSKEGRLTLNMVGLGKWLLRYGFEFEFLWLRVVDSKLGSQGGWCSNQVSEPNGVGL